MDFSSIDGFTKTGARPYRNLNKETGMPDSLRVVASSLADSVDWVAECAHRQAILIERINSWMDWLQASLLWGAAICIIWITLDTVIKRKKMAEK